jgi:methylmalonyl-CoA mutase
MSGVPQLSDFPPASREEWQRRIEKVLGGGTFETLRSRTADGIIIEPLYPPAGDSAIESRGAGQAWTILQRVDHPEPGAAQELALDDVNNGASGLVLTFSGAPSARGFGLKAPDARSIGLALRDVPLHALHLRLEAGGRSLAAAEAMRDVFGARSLNPEQTRVSFGIDPIGALAAEGKLGDAWGDVAGRMAGLIKSLAVEFKGPFVMADGRVFHDGGGSEAEELGCALATAVSYLRTLEGTLDDVAMARAISMTLSADADIFMSLAKFRAARLAWRQLMHACGLPDAQLDLHGETSWRMMTRVDAHGNLLRNVAAVFGAGLGGANSFCALPFSLAAGLPDGFARRMARNVQSIAIEEANAHRVCDPAAGSGYVEHLTTSITEKAWEVFQEIERHGGMIGALQKGFVQERIRRRRQQRLDEIAAGKRAITGVTTFANGSEVFPSILPVERQRALDIDPQTAIPAKRDAEDFEAGRRGI